jgi:SAM-dependent methyltransferase
MHTDLNADALLDVFDDLPFWAAPFGLDLLDFVAIRKGLQVLDIGFGAGFPLVELAQRIGTTGTLVGLDPWQAGHRRTQRKLAFYEIGNVNLVEAVAEAMPFRDSAFDTIVSNNGLNNVQDLPRALAECSRVLRSGGQLVLTQNTESSFLELYEIFRRVCRQQNWLDALPKIEQHIRSKRLPLHDLLPQIQLAGFVLRKRKHNSFCYRFADADALWSHWFVRLAFLDSWFTFVAEDQLASFRAQVSVEIDTLCERNGFFELTVPFITLDCVLAK